MAVPVSAYLADFLVLGGANGARDTRKAQGARVADRGADRQLPALLAEAEARGRLDGASAAEAAAEARLLELRTELQQQHALERSQWLENQAQRLAGDLREGFAELTTTIAGAVAAILAPFVDQAIQRETVTELAAAVRALLADPEQPLLRVKGPQDLLESLQAELRAESEAVNFIPDESCEITVLSGSTAITTRLQAWSEKLQQAAA